MSISNVLDSFDPIVRQRNYAPTRTFVTKWDFEIDRNRVKKINRGRDRTAKYFHDVEFADYYPVNADVTRVRFKELCDEIISFDTYQYDTYQYDTQSDDGDGEETRQAWLRAVHAENAYYERKYPINVPEINRKRALYSDVVSDFKRPRNDIS